MPDPGTISLIAKILARATSPEPAEALASLHHAFRRMDRDGISLSDLLTLPVQELYQDALVKLVDLLLMAEVDLSPEGRREAYAAYMSAIAAKFAPEKPARDAEAREYAQRRAARETPRGADTSSSSCNKKAGKELNRFYSESPKFQNGFAAKWQVKWFSLSPAAFFKALAPTFGQGSLFAHSLGDPGRCLQLLAASLLWGMTFAGVLILLASTVHALTGTMPWIDVRLSNVFTVLSAAGTIWKGRALFQGGWFY